MVLAVALDLEPFPAPRPRARAFQVAPGKWTASIYTPRDGDYRSWQAAAVLLLRAATRGAPPMEGPLGLKVVFRLAMPKGEHLTRSIRARRWHVATPDTDNLLKALQDAMKEAGCYKDDSRIAEVVMQKIVGSQVERPAIHVTLYPLAPLV